MKVASNIYQLSIPTPFAIGNVYAYLLVEETVTLIDAGIYTEEAWRSFNDQLTHLGMHVDQIDQILLTHHHPDHTGLISYFKQTVPIAAHPRVDVWLKRDEVYFSSYIEFFKDAFVKWGVPKWGWTDPSFFKGTLDYAGVGEVTIPLDHLDRVPGHDEWIVLYTPGHAQTHISLYLEKDNLLIGGDHLLQTVAPNPLLEGPYEKGAERTKPLVQFRKSLQDLRTFDIRRVLPGHGPIITKVDELIEQRLHQYSKRAQFVKGLLRQQSQTAYALSLQLYPRQTSDQLMLVLSQTIGLLDLLEEDKQITKYVHNGEFVYTPVEVAYQ